MRQARLFVYTVRCVLRLVGNTHGVPATMQMHFAPMDTCPFIRLIVRLGYVWSLLYPKFIIPESIFVMVDWILSVWCVSRNIWSIHDDPVTWGSYSWFICCKYQLMSKTLIMKVGSRTHWLIHSRLLCAVPLPSWGPRKLSPSGRFAAGSARLLRRLSKAKILIIKFMGIKSNILLLCIVSGFCKVLSLLTMAPFPFFSRVALFNSQV